MLQKVLVLGAAGQLGEEFRRLSPEYPYSFTFLRRHECDVIAADSPTRIIESLSPDYIINCIAYTAVDKAEDEPGVAQLINAGFVRDLARLASKKKITLVHFSTDYVFDGLNLSPYDELDKTGPLSVYGRSKLAGEQAIIEEGCRGAIFRTSWLYSAQGQNFVHTIRRLGNEREVLKVVGDQVGTPTYAGDLAEVVLRRLAALNEMNGEIFHYSNEGVASWCDFAKVIISRSELKTRVESIESKDFSTKAQRPRYSVMNKNKIKNRLGIVVPNWVDSFEVCLRQLRQKAVTI